MLSDADKKRIEEEEAYRAQVRARIAAGEAPSTKESATSEPQQEEVLYVGSASMRAHPLRFWGSLFVTGTAIAALIAAYYHGVHPYVLYVIPVVVLVELLFLAGWWIKTRSAKLTITNLKTTLELGWFSRNRVEVFHSDVRTIEVQQTFINRLTGHGTFQISSAGESDWEIKLADLPNVQRARDIVQQYRKS